MQAGKGPVTAKTAVKFMVLIVLSERIIRREWPKLH